MKTSQTRIVLALIAVFACLLMAGAALAQGEQKINVQYAGTELGKVLETFKRFDPSFAYTLPPGYENKAITAGLVDVTIEEALTIVLDQVGLRFFKDNNLYSIREKAERDGGRVGRPITTAYGTPVITTRPTQPTAQAGGAASTATGEKKEGEDERKNLPIRMIKVRFADPALLSDIFGGDIIEGGYGGTSGGSSGSSYSSNSGGSSRGGSSRSSGSSSSSRSSGSSSSSRSSGSSRGSSRSNY